MSFRYFDAAGNQLTSEQLRTMQVTTPAMEHVFVTAEACAGKMWNKADNLEEPPAR